MNALVKKEIRLLLPSWGMALALAFSMFLVADDQPTASRWRQYSAALSSFLGPALAVMMALSSFGRELGAGTLSNLLAQPVSRERIWWTKTLLLAAAMFSVWAVAWFSLSHNLNVTVSPGEQREFLIATVMIALVAYAGGLWTVLLFRQVAAAFWFTLLVPGALAMVVMYVTQKLASDTATETSLIAVLVAYSIAGFIWARRLFLRTQDVQWTGGEITLPRWLRLPRWVVPATSKGGRRPCLALLVKEFQLHQSQFVIAGVLALLHVGMMVARKAGGGFKEYPAMEFLAFQFWVFWLVMPLLIGCAAVAEERRLGTLEAQLCSPARRRTQFLIKFGVAFALSVIFGLTVPLLFEGRRILPDIHFQVGDATLDFWTGVPQGSWLLHVLRCFEMISPVLPYLPLLLISMTLLAISFYTSTLARNTLQSIAPAILGVVLIWALLVGADAAGQTPYNPLWRGWLIFIIGVPVLAVTLAGLAYWNFNHVLVGWPVWRRNLLTLVAALALVMALTSATYHRAWELFAPLEPPHRTARLSASQVALRHDSANFLAHLRDDGLWSGRFMVLPSPSGTKMLAGDQTLIEVFPAGRLLEGTNWSSVVICWRDVVAIQKDGTLWASGQSDERLSSWRVRTNSRPEPLNLIRLGTESDWKSVVGSYPPAILLKSDGTLWRLGGDWRSLKTNWPGLRAFEPQRLGTDSDWAELISDGDRMRLKKTDGRTWVRPGFGGSSNPQSATLRLDEQIIFERAPYLDGTNWRSLAWVSAPRGGLFQVGVHEDGTFRLFRVHDMWRLPSGTLPPPARVKLDVQLGSESNWLDVSGYFNVVVALKADGTLWRWHFPEDPVTKPNSAFATRLGTHSDWVAVTTFWDSVVSLAADGSLWYWQLEPGDSVVPGTRMPPLLAPSRKPQKFANIFNELR